MPRLNCEIAMKDNKVSKGVERRLEKPSLPAQQLAEKVFDGATIMIGGFMSVGAPTQMLRTLQEMGRSNLCLIATDCGTPGSALSNLIMSGSVSRIVASFLGSNPEVQSYIRKRNIEVELLPQGTLVECIRAGGAGLGGVLTRTALDTEIGEGRRIVSIAGEDWLLETPLRADFSLISCFRVDTYGNAVYRKTGRNFNPVMALAGQTVIVEPKELVACGEIDPDHIVTPGLLIDYLVDTKT